MPRPSAAFRPHDPTVDAARKRGSKIRKKHQERGTYPEHGIPIERHNLSDREIAYTQRAYYQQLPNTGDAVTARTAAQHLGYRIEVQALERRLLEAWGDEINGIIEGADGWTIVSGQSSYTAPTPFEAVILMLCDRS
jgi:hypothetical protein